MEKGASAMKLGPDTPPPNPPRQIRDAPAEYGRFKEPMSEPIDGLDRLRTAFLGLTEDDWCELARQMHSPGAPPIRLFSRPAVISWLKTWVHRT
jgi:hypothetical protein